MKFDRTNLFGGSFHTPNLCFGSKLPENYEIIIPESVKWPGLKGG